MDDPLDVLLSLRSMERVTLLKPLSTHEFPLFGAELR